MLSRDERHSFMLLPDARCVIVAGHRTVLQYKVWQVLNAIKDAAPEIVSREELIDTIWQGNFATGEKALNQALWAIRSALNDAAKAPQFICTVPRVGYRWVGPVSSPIEKIFTRFSHGAPGMKTPLIGVGLGVMCLLAIVFFYPQMAAIPPVQGNGWTPPRSAPGSSTTKSHAYFQGRDLIVKFDGDRILVIKPSGEKIFGKPILSEDGWRIAFHVTEPRGCRLVMIHLATLDRLDFGACSTFEQSELRPARLI